MVTELSAKFTLPPIANIFLPPFYKGGQPKDAQFMAIGLAGGAVGVSFVLLPDEKMGEYNRLQSSDFVNKNPRRFALEFGDDDPLKEMISLATINAICQHVMRETHFAVDYTTYRFAGASVGLRRRPGRHGRVVLRIDQDHQEGQCRTGGH